MSEEIRILMLEDVATDAVMINRELRKGGFSFRSKRVDNKKDFLHELESNPPDVILSDHGLPSFDGFSALAIARNTCPDTPFIFVTGSLGEEKATETLKSGATDYVLKERLPINLVPAIRRALRQSEDRRKRSEVERALLESEERFRLLVDGVKDYALCMLNPQGRIVSWNYGAECITGYNANHAVGQHFSLFFTPEDIEAGKPEHMLLTSKQEGRYEGESWQLKRGGSRFFGDVIVNAVRDQSGQSRGYALVIRDVTERKRTQEALHKSWARYRQLAELFPDAVLVQANNEVIFANQAAAWLLGADSADQLLHKPMQNFVHRDHWERLRDHMARLREEGTTFFLKRVRESREEHAPAPLNEVPLVRLDGTTANVLVAAAPVTFQEQPSVILFAYDMKRSRRTPESGIGAAANDEINPR